MKTERKNIENVKNINNIQTIIISRKVEPVPLFVCHKKEEMILDPIILQKGIKYFGFILTNYLDNGTEFIITSSSKEALKAHVHLTNNVIVIVNDNQLNIILFNTRRGNLKMSAIVQDED